MIGLRLEIVEARLHTSLRVGADLICWGRASASRVTHSLCTVKSPEGEQCDVVSFVHSRAHDKIWQVSMTGGTVRQSTPWLLFIAALIAVAHAGTIPNYPFVYVTGRADVRVPPNVADTTFTVLAESPRAGVAEHTVESRVTEVLILLRSAGVRDSQIDASGLTKEAVTNNDDSERKPLSIRGYRVSRQIEAKISDLKNWPQIATHLLQVQNVTDVQVTFGRSDAKGIEESLLGKAAKDAKKRAHLLAVSFGQHVWKVMALSQSQFDTIDGNFLGGLYGNGTPQMVMIAPPPGDSTLLVPSSIKLSVEVHAIVTLQ